MFKGDGDGGVSDVSWTLLRVQVLQVGVAQRVLSADVSTRCPDETNEQRQ